MNPSRLVKRGFDEVLLKERVVEVVEILDGNNESSDGLLNLFIGTMEFLPDWG